MEQKTMNMISTGTFLTEMEASDKQKNSLVSKLVGAWEQKNSKTARAGGVSLMALSLAACGSSEDTDTVSYSQDQLDAAKLAAAAAVDITTDNAAAVAAVDITTDNAAAVAAVDITTDNAVAATTALRDAAAALDVTGTASMTDAELITAIKTANDAAIASAVDITTDNAAAVAAVDITTDNATAATTALRDAAAALDVTGTSSMTDAELITAIKTANDTAIAAAVDITTDNAAAVAAVDITTDNATATTAALRDAAADLGVTGTSTMTDAELVTAIKVANDTAIASGVDLTTDNTAATNAAVTALGYSGVTTLAQLQVAYDNLLNPPTLTTGQDTLTGDGTNQAFDAGTAGTLNATDSITDSSTTDSDTLTANIGGNLGLTLTNVENVTLNVTASATLDFTNVSGTTAISNTNNTAGANLVLDNLGSVPTVNISSTDDDTTINFTNVALAGGSDHLTVNLSSLSTNSTVVVTSDAGTNTLETLTINSNGVPNTVADVQTTSAGVTTLNIGGSNDLSITTVLDNRGVAGNCCE
jgi:ribosomal protein S18